MALPSLVDSHEVESCLRKHLCEVCVSSCIVAKARDPLHYRFPFTLGRPPVTLQVHLFRWVFNIWHFDAEWVNFGEAYRLKVRVLLVEDHLTGVDQLTITIVTPLRCRRCLHLFEHHVSRTDDLHLVCQLMVLPSSVRFRILINLTHLVEQLLHLGETDCVLANFFHWGPGVLHAFEQSQLLRGSIYLSVMQFLPVLVCPGL